MFEETKKPLREFASSEPLEKRARRMTDLPAEIVKERFDALPQDVRDVLQGPVPPVYEINGPVYRLTGVTSALSAVARNKVIGTSKKIPNGMKMVRVSILENVAELEVHFFNTNYLNAILKAFNAGTRAANEIFPISGGARLRGGSALGQVQVGSVKGFGPPAIRMPDNDQPVLILTVRPIGDYSTYTLELQAPGRPVSLFDPLFSEISFKFRPGCFNTNCAPLSASSAPLSAGPPIDYLAKDYESFRATMIAAMMERVPEWEPTSEADLDMVLAELFSVAADELSDYQDRVMNEAYLSSARKRVSLARHARMMDYHIHQGNQASTQLALEIGHDDTPNKKFKLSGDLMVWAGESPLEDRQEETDSSRVFHSRLTKPGVVHQNLNSIALYTWSDTITTLRAGSTTADLMLYNRLYLDEDNTPPEEKDTVEAAGEAEALEIGDLIRAGDVKYLLLEEHLNPESGFRAGYDPKNRQLLRLLPGADGAIEKYDPINDKWFVRVRWEKADALLRDYCFTVDFTVDDEGTTKANTPFISLFHGNLIKVFHGRRTTVQFVEEDAGPPDLKTGPDQPRRLHYERTTRWGTLCRLPEAALAYRYTGSGGKFGEVAPLSTLEVSVGQEKDGTFETWHEKPSLIHSDDSAEMGDHFIVETDENRQSTIRFGNGKNGMEIPKNYVVRCTYQYGEPLEGNTGADTIVNFYRPPVPDPDKPGIIASPDSPTFNLKACWNPLGVTNGRDREPAVEIIRRVPEAYRYRQRRAVTLADYVARAEEVPDVSRAAASYAWTGSWRTVRITIDPAGTNELSEKLTESVASYLDAVRLIGEDLEIRPPIFVPLEIRVTLCAAPDVWPEDLQFVLEEEFSAGWTPDGRKAFFHPDLWTFGQPLHASQIIGQALKIKGVEHIVAQRSSLGRSGPEISVAITRRDSNVTTDSMTRIGHNEIIQVMSDPNHMEKGFIKFKVKGGRQ